MQQRQKGMKGGGREERVSASCKKRQSHYVTHAKAGAGKSADGPFAARLGLVGFDRVTDVRHILIDPANDAAFMITRTSLGLLVRPGVSVH